MSERYIFYPWECKVHCQKRIPDSLRVGQGGVAGCTRRVQTGMAISGLAVERPWLVPGGPILTFCFACMDLEISRLT